MTTDKMINDLLKIMIVSKDSNAYLKSVLKFQLGRKPTEEEVEQLVKLVAKRKKERAEYDAAQPWCYRKKLISREERAKAVLRKRYNVPEFLIDEIEGEW
jgi:hypothetical protein